jgi:hypothetical protein
MTDVPEKLPPYQSPLERRPRYVRAIGMITIEITNLEIFLGDLLSVLLHVPPDIGRTIYLTPRAATARLETLENVRDRVLTKDGKPHHAVTSLTKRARRIFDRRHAMVHHSWGLRKGRVHRRPVPWDSGAVGEQVKLSALNEIIRDIRVLATDVLAQTYELHQSWENLLKQRAALPEKHQQQVPVSDPHEPPRKHRGSVRKHRPRSSRQ